MPETVGSGCAFLDYNGDGWLDLLFVNSTDWPGAGAKAHFPVLYRNNGDGTFTDGTREAGLAHDSYGMGVAVGDYDNDGRPDVYLTCLGPNHLYHNNGDGTFTDVTARAGTEGEPVEPGGLKWKWSASAAWLDYDRDGRLDLFVTDYVKWTPATDMYCSTNGLKSYCPPSNYEGNSCILYHNEGNGRFRDVSEETGIRGKVGKSFGIAQADYNGDGWPDLAVSNDTVDNFLFLNQEGKRFEERGPEAGIALSPGGAARAGMGIDAADWANDGRFGLVIGNFSREGLALYRGQPGGVFQEVSYPSNVGEPSLLSLTFGVFFFDYNLDGWQDIFAANGHIDDFVEMKDARVRYAQLPLLFTGGPDTHFRPAGPAAGDAFSIKRVLRGCAHGDFDNDGDPDVAVVWNNHQGELWRNEGGNRNGWVGLVLQGARSNRDGIGAVVRVSAGGLTQTAYRHSGGSFLSESDPRLSFGLGAEKRAERIEIVWPSGATSQYEHVEGNRYYLAVEGERALCAWTPHAPGAALH